MTKSKYYFTKIQNFSILLFFSFILQYTKAFDFSKIHTYTTSSKDADTAQKEGYGFSSDRQWFRLLWPKELSYYYPMQLSQNFGTPLTQDHNFITSLVLAEPIDACKQLIPKARSYYKNNVVLAIRGGCSFLEKTLNIQNAGGKVALIYNNEKSDALIAMGQDETNRENLIHISPYFISHSDGENIHKAIKEHEEIIKKDSKIDKQIKNLKNEKIHQKANTFEEKVEKATNDGFGNLNRLLFEDLALVKILLPVNETQMIQMQPPWRSWHLEL